MEGAFRAAYKDFKSECLSFLKQVEEKDDLEVRHYEISDPYTMFYAEVGDKEAVFLMSGDHPNGFPSTEALHQGVIGLQNCITKGSKGGNESGGKHRRDPSRVDSLASFSSLEEVFRTMDLDGNGTIDEAEFTTGLGVLGVDWKDSKIKKLFNQIDEEEEGAISLDAFMRFMMTPSNKSSWKELKNAINASISVPTAKAIKESALSPESYQKKLSQIEKLVNMMEEALVEQQLPAEEQQYWKNKILAHREFIRAHQDAVGKAMGSDNSKLKKKLHDLEKKNRRLSEFAVSMGLDPEDDKALKKAAKKDKGKRSGSVQLAAAVGADDDKEALIRRLRRDNEEFKRKIQSQQGDLRKLQQEVKRSGSTTPRSASRRGKLNLDEQQVEEMMSKLKKENYEMRNERNELRKERDALATQLQSAKDKIKKLEEMTGGDEDLLKQLYAARKDAKEQRKKKRDLEAEAIKLKGISNALQRKLMALAKRVSAFDPEMGTRIMEKTTANDMIDELATQLTDMIERYEKAMEEVKRLKKMLKDQQKKYEVDLQNMKDKLKERKQTIKERDARIAELEEQLKDKNDELENMTEKLQEAQEYHQENKKYKRKIKDLQDEIAQFEQMRENYAKELAEAQQREKNFKKQLKMMERMPGNASMIKKIDRLHKMFLKLDKDGDGLLNFDEFQAGAADLGFGETLEEQQDAFNAMDKDSDGFVNFEDFKQACLRNIERSQNKSDDEWKMTYKLLSKPPSKWNNEDVNLWLSHIGMESYQEEFDNVDGNMLINMKNQRDLKDWGVQKNAHVRKMMREIKDLKARDDLLSNLAYENDKLKTEMDNMNKNGPTWEAVHTLQRKIRDLEGQVRKEKYARENIMINVKDALKKDKRFDNISPDYEDVLAEVALLKGALADANQKLTNKDNAKPDTGDAYENEASAPSKMKNYGQPIGRFLQKWYVLANHSTQYWISRTNEELQKRDDHYKKMKAARKKKKQREQGSDDEKYEDNDGDESDPEEERDEEYTESLDWILFDTRQKRLISELRVAGRGAPNDPKDIKLQMSASPSGPWTTVKEHQMKNDGEREKVGGFEAEARFWRVCFLSNYGQQEPDAPRYVLYECQFWGPLDDEVENNHFVIE